MNTIFISDLHLSQESTHRTKLFINFLETNYEKIDKLYILGDFFNYWVGDDIHLEQFKPVIRALNTFNTPRKRTFIMHGNRDFLYGDQFFIQTKSSFIPDPYFIKQHDKKIMLTHGDLLFDKSLIYQIYRRTCITLSKLNIIKSIFLSLPKTFRISIANKLRQKSQTFNKNRMFDHDNKDFLHTIIKNNSDILIHGHTHNPCVQILRQNKELTQRYTLGDWEEYGNMLIITDDSSPKLTYFS